MARVKKGDASKAKKGAAKNYITRTQAVRRLQISLPDFRRLCIFKGIYPREPRNKKKVLKGATTATTFYYTKDVQYLQHEPLLQKFREHNALAKKIGRALGRNEVSNAARLERNKPQMTLDHLVKERYPSFVDALRDLDDALSMLFLFASLPSTTYVPAKTIALCQRLCLEFQHFVIVSRSLRKSFLSIKGIYYQATIQGQDIMWLVPYKFVQTMAGDIDFRIMSTFIEFYTTLLGFVNYRLYTTIGLVYPPKFDSASDAKGGELGAFTLEGQAVREIKSSESLTNDHEARDAASSTVQAVADELASMQENFGASAAAENEQEDRATDAIDAIDSFKPIAAADADILLQPTALEGNLSSLFSKCTFYLSRETPKTSLEFILKAFGCHRVGWDNVLGDGAFTTDETDLRITHQVVDRPPITIQEVEMEDYDETPATARVARVPGRAYIQPQWVWDSINQAKLLRPDLYAPGVIPPPHLSPWMKPKAGIYDPTMPLVDQERPDEAELDEYEGQEEMEPTSASDGDKANITEDAEEEAEDSDGVGDMLNEPISDSEVEGGAELTDEDIEEAEEADNDSLADDYQLELAAEASGLPFNVQASSDLDKVAETRKRKVIKDKKAQEELDRQRMMMPNKKRKLFDKMQFGNKKREAEAEKLRKKRRRIERDVAKKAL